MSKPADIYYLNGPSIIVDDSDPAILYNGTWNAADETAINSTIWLERTPIFNTLHVLEAFAGSFSYNFTGVGVSVFATPVDNTNYTSQCFLDGNAVNIDPGKSMFGQSRPVCTVFGLPANSVHTISVVVSVPPRNQADPGGSLSGFAFDYILMQPVPGVSLWTEGDYDIFLPILNVKGLLSGSPNPALNFGMTILGDDGDIQIANVTRTWNYDPENGFYTSTSGSQFNMTFTGTCLWWYGFYNGSAVSFPVLGGLLPATFSIDNGPPSLFGGVRATTTSQAYISRTQFVQNGKHLLTVGYHGGNQSQSLTLQSVIIQRSVPLTPSFTGRSTPSMAASDLPIPPPPPKHTKQGVIAGSVAGGVVFLFIITSGVYALTRWRRRKRQTMQIGSQSANKMPELHPFPTEGHVSINGPRKARASESNAEHPLMQPLQEPPLTKWTRRNHITDGLEPSSNSYATLTHEQRHSVTVITRPLSADDSQVRPTILDPTSTHSVPHVLGDYLHPTTPAIPGFSNFYLDLDDGGREEDSGLRMTQQENSSAFVPILPPIYTIH